MRNLYLTLFVLFSLNSFGQKNEYQLSSVKSQDSLVNKFEFYSFKNEFPILEGKNSVYNLILTNLLIGSSSLSFNYSLKKTLIGSAYIDDKPNSQITSKVFLNILGDMVREPKELFKNHPDDFKNSIFTFDIKSIKKSFISYDNNGYYIGETISDNGKLIKKGYGAYFFNNGDRYEGFWNNDLKNGEGCMFYKTTSLNGVKKEILYHINDSIVFKSMTFLSNGDFIYTKGKGKYDQTYFYLNKTNPGIIGVYKSGLVNNLPNGDGVKSNYQNGKFLSEVRGVFVDGKISVLEKKKTENLNYTAVSNNSNDKGKATSLPTPNKSIKYGGILLGELNGNIWVSSTEDAPYELSMEGVNSARNYCWNLDLNGYSDWILPTSETIQLQSFRKLLLPQKDSYYWLDIKDGDFKTYTFMTNGQIKFSVWNNDKASVRCVRYFK
jgi:hypothetical protein